MERYKLHPKAKQSGIWYGLIGVAIIAGIVWYGHSITWGVGEQNKPGTYGSREENPAVAEHAQTVDDGLPDRVMIEGVPFTSQAPTAKWEDNRFQNACEEASILMAMKWIRQERFSGAADAEAQLLELSAKANEMFGTYVDSSAADTLKLFRSEMGSTWGTLRYDVSIQDIKKELAAGHVVLAPADGQALNNPNFSGAGPERHFLAIVGYDDEAGVFITNDPGTRNGQNYRYKYETLHAALRDYPTGDHAPIHNIRRAILVIPRSL